ncbi:hypothetical protein SO802_032757 [Lithocarpus litseifolius]|uniref:Protein FAR1-RELATED SEQUENCE n=1 Tax=Lithocarpus litseifolius TaxID=425828 RepID=A0AAW2BBN6_9ROSI
MQQLPISPDYMSIPPLHPLPPSLIPPHSVSHSTDAAPVNSPPRTTAPTAPSFLGILRDSDKCNGSQFVQEEAQVKSIDGSSNTPSKHNEEIKAPMIGMKFDCDDSAYEFYKQYAHRMGFSVRKQYVRRGNAGHVKRRTFCCSKEGERAIDKRREQVSFHHPISRIGCLAQMTCQLQKDDENEWMVAWNNMLETYDLTDNPWLREMFDVKEKWCMVYGRHMFTADMKSTQRSESMNSVLKKYLKPKHGLLQFFEHYSRVLSDKRHQELQSEFKMRQTLPVLLFDFEMLRHAAKLYTPEIFKMFQDEYVKIVDCTIYKASKSDSITKYRVKYRNKTQEHLVKYEASTTTVQCSCMKFSFLGILCSHALKVLDKKNIKIIPAHYVLKRWTQDAKVGSIKDYRGTDIKGNARESVGKRLCHLSHKCLQINTLAAEREMMYEHVDKSFDKLLKDLQEMRIKCCLSSMEGQVHGEVVPENVLQGDGGFESHVDISQDIRGIKTKPTVGRPRGRLKSSLERKKKKSSGQKDQPKKTSGARQVQSRSGLNKVDSSANLNSHKECSNVEQPSQLVENITQVSVDPNIDNL